jgi:hypothetical protein
LQFIHLDAALALLYRHNGRAHCSYKCRRIGLCQLCTFSCKAKALTNLSIG